MLTADVKIKREGIENLTKSDIVGALTGDLSKKAVEIAKDNSRVDTGRMRAGWNRSKIGTKRQGGWRIYNSVEYAVHNEYGTVRMSAQPMIGPAIEQISGMIPEEARKIISAGVNGVVSGGGEE